MLRRPNGQIIYPPDRTQPPPRIIIEHGRVIDPANDIDDVLCIALEDGIVKAVGPQRPPGFEPQRVIDARNKWVVPGLMDMHVHLREPGREDRETLESGTCAAAAGGFTAVACMPNTNPVLDEESKIRYVVQRAETCPCRIYPLGAITKNQQGEELAPFGEMTRAGARGFTDDGMSVMKTNIMRNALNYAKSFGAPIISHCEDSHLGGGHMNEGVVSARLGIRGIPSIAEEIFVARDVMLAEYTNSRLHIAHVSTAGSVEIIRQAKKRGVPVTAETCPHYFVLTEEALATYDTHKKMNPPLRTAADRDAIIMGLADGVIDVIATDHAPHVSEDKKDVEFEAASFGVVGLETAVGIVLTYLVQRDILMPSDLVEKMSIMPNRILKTRGGSLSIGAAADVTIIDPAAPWTVEPQFFFSKARNSPFEGFKLQGYPCCTIVDGRVVYERNRE